MTSCNRDMTSFNHDVNSFEHECNVSRSSELDTLPVFKNYELDMSTSFDNSIHEESSFASNNMCFEHHPLEDSFTSCLSSLNETEFEFNSSPYFSIETYFPQEETRKLNHSPHLYLKFALI